MTGRALSVVVALMLAPAMARSDPGSPDQGGSEQAPPAATTAPKVPPEMMNRTDFTLTLTTLDALRKQGKMTEEEYNAALRQLIEVGQRAATSPTFVLARFVTTLYGYLEGVFVHDTQRSFVEQYGGHPTLALPGTFAGDNGRTVFSARGTRLGLRFAAPQVSGVRVRGLFEMDFLGNSPFAVINSAARVGTETNFYVNATPRIRHALMQIDTEIATLWIGQTWSLIGFEAAFFPTSVQYQGLPGQLFSRNPQIRLSRIFDAKAFTVEVAAGAQRPPQQDYEIPDLQGGVKINVPSWTGVQSIGGTSTTISPLSVAVSGALRWFKLATAATATGASTTATTSVTGNAIAVDAFVPVIQRKERGEFALSLLGEYTTGSGYSDLFTGLNGGAGVGQPVGVTAATYAPFQNLDPGPAGWDINGTLRTVQWRTLLLDAQISYGKWVLAGNYSNVYSDNVQLFTGANWFQQTFWDANLIVDPLPGVRFGLEFARTLQRKVAGNALANNSRIFFTGLFLF